MAETERLALRMNEAAEVLGISRSKAYELARRGEIPVVRIGHSVRVPVNGLRRWLEAQEEAWK